MGVEDEIIQALSKPSFPAEIAQKINRDSIQTTAILDYLYNAGKIKRTKRMVGTSYIYYLPDQEEQAKQMLFEYLSSPEKALINKIKEARFIPLQSLSQDERLLLGNLDDFVKLVSLVDKEGNKITYVVYYKEDPNIILQKEKPKEVKEQKQTQIPSVSKRKKEINIDFSQFSISISQKISENSYLGEYGPLKLPIIVFIEGKLTTKKLIEYLSLSKSLHRYCIIFTNSSLPVYDENCKVINMNNPNLV